MNCKRYKLTRIAGLLAAVMLFLYGIAPLTHSRGHWHSEGAQLASSHQPHSAPAFDASTSEDSDACALCALQAVEIAATELVPEIAFVALPLPAYAVAAFSPSSFSACLMSRGPPRAPPSLV